MQINLYRTKTVTLTPISVDDSTSASVSPGGIPLIAANILRCSSTVSTSKMMLNWGQIPTRCFISKPSAISATGEP